MKGRMFRGLSGLVGMVLLAGVQNIRAELVVSNPGFESPVNYGSYATGWYVYSNMDPNYPAVTWAPARTGNNSLVISTKVDSDSSKYYGVVQWLGAGNQFEANTEYTLHIWTSRHEAYSTVARAQVSLWALDGPGEGSYGGTYPIVIDNIIPPPYQAGLWTEYTGTVSTVDHPELVGKYAAVSIVMFASAEANPAWIYFDDVSITSRAVSEVEAIPGLKYWFKADTGVTADGEGKVSAWTNQADAVANAVQTTSDNQPVLVSDGIDGKPVIRFDGIDDILSGPSNMWDEVNLNVYVVAKYRNTSAPYQVLFGMSMGQNDWSGGSSWFYMGGSAGPIVENSVVVNRPYEGAWSVANGVLDRNPHVFGMNFTGDVSLANILDGVVQTDTTNPYHHVWLPGPDNSYIARFDIGAINESGTLYNQAAVDIAEIILYNAALSETDRATVENYLNAKYGLPVNVPADRGHRILMDRGLQIQAQVSAALPGFDLARWAVSNFTTVNAQWCPILAQLGEAPGIPWGYWVHPESGQPQWDYLAAWTSGAYAPNLVSLQVGDELDVNNSAAQSKYLELYTQVRQIVAASALHNILVYSNQGGGQASWGAMRSFMQACQPDMVMFDTYPFGVYGNNSAGGSPTDLYNDMVMYRNLALGGNDGTGTTPIPYGLYLQTFTMDVVWPRAASDSEMRLNEFSAWTFGYTFVSAFVYTSSGTGSGDCHATLFSGADDSSPTAAFTQIAETNRQSRNLGPALVRLLSTDIRMIPGLHGSGETNSLPSGMTSGIAGADPYLTGVSAQNLGSKNASQRGDVLVGFFKPLMTDAAYPDERYFMVTNGLSDPTGLAFETRQKITLTLNFGTSGITGLQRLSRTTGYLENVALVHDGGSLYHLDLTLDGGTGDLFKYNTGAPFVSDPEAQPVIPGDANKDGKVDVSDLGILAANYGATAGATWETGDFNTDGKVDVSDLGILAANYGTGTGAALDFNADAKALGLSTEAKEDMPTVSQLGCGSLGLPLVAGLILMGMLLVKLDE